MVVGTIEGSLMVWTQYNGSHGWLPQCTKISTKVSIVSLSFRNDGSILAVGATPIASTPHDGANSNGLIDKIYFYETSNWTCVRSLNLNSNLGLCDFFKLNDVISSQNYFKDTNLKRNSNSFYTFLLVFTIDGPQIHCIPEIHGPISEECLKHNVFKTVRWADSEKQNNIEEIIDFESDLNYFTQKPHWNNRSTNTQLLSNKDEGIQNNKTHSLRLRGGKSNEASSGSCKKWSTYNVVKNEAQEQLHKYKDRRKLYTHSNNHNGYKDYLVKSIDANKRNQEDKMYYVAHDILPNIEKDVEDNIERKNQWCQIDTPLSNLCNIKTKYKDSDNNIVELQSKSSHYKRTQDENMKNRSHVYQEQSTSTNHLFNGSHYSMMTEALQPFCKPLLHRMVFNTGTGTASLNSQQKGDCHITTACHLHASHSVPWPPCPVHGGVRPPQSMAESSSIACSPRENHLNYEADFSEDGNGGSESDVKREQGGGGGSWSDHAPPEKELKKACEKLCEQIQWKSEKHYQEVARSSFRNIVQGQAVLHALHEESRRSDLRQSKEDYFNESVNNGRRHREDRGSLSLGQSHNSFSDATFAKPFRECCKERPVSAPTRDRTSASPERRRSLVSEDLLKRYSVSTRPHDITGGNVACKGVVPLHISPLLRKERFRSKSADKEKPRFCTGLNRGKGETEDAGAKKMLNVVPVIMLHRDKTKGVWNRKANQKEWDHGHRGCCSQHWVSVLGNNDKVLHADGRKALSARASLSPVPKGKFAAMSTQKLKVRGGRCRPQVARSLDLSSSPLSSLKAIVNDMSRPQSASLPKRNNSVSTPRSTSTTSKSDQKPSIAVAPARKLNNPELNSSAWLLAKMEELRKETFTEPKALQIAKEHGIMLDDEDEAALKNFLQTEQSPRLDRAVDAAERGRDKNLEKYFNLSNIKLSESAVAARYVRKQLSPKACAASIRERCKNSTSDLSKASEHCSQTGDLNAGKNAPTFSDQMNIRMERCRETSTNTSVISRCHT